MDAFENIQANRHYVIEQRTVDEFVDSMPNAVSKQALFRDVSDALGHQHVDPAFNEFVRQPLLPRKMSRVGPGVAWADLNGDRHDDLVFGEGQGEAISVYYGDGQGGWKAERLPSSALPTDITGVLVHKVSDTRAELIVAESGYELSLIHI